MAKSSSSSGKMWSWGDWKTAGGYVPSDAELSALPDTVVVELKRLDPPRISSTGKTLHLYALKGAVKVGQFATLNGETRELTLTGNPMAYARLSKAEVPAEVATSMTSTKASSAANSDALAAFRKAQGLQGRSV